MPQVQPTLQADKFVPSNSSESQHKLHRCQKPAKLQCPKCQELSLPKATSSFCSQECFKVSSHGLGQWQKLHMHMTCTLSQP